MRFKSSFILPWLKITDKALLDQISKLLADSADSIFKRASVEAVADQLKEIRKLRREESKSFKRKGK